MPLTNTATRYGSIAKVFHWSIAIGILAMIPLGLIAADAPYGTADELTRKALLFSIHKTLGVTIFLLALARIGWAVSQLKPVALHPERRTETFLAELVHWLLYGSLVLVPLSGWIEHAATDGFAPILWPFGQALPFVPKSPALAEIFATAHWLLQWVLTGSVVLHIAGALKHHVVDRDATLRRMWFGRAEAGTYHAPHRVAAPLGALVVWVATFGAAWATGAFTTDQRAPRPALTQVESGWQVTEGTLALTVRQMGKEIEGVFSDWTAEIDFDDTPGLGEKGSVSVTVAIPSLTLGSVTTQALGPDFLAGEAHPTATFVAPIVRAEEGYIADGTLTLKDTEVPVTLPFALDLTGDNAHVSGGAVLDRRAFGVGKSMTDAQQLGFEVSVSVDLTATRSAR